MHIISFSVIALLWDYFLPSLLVNVMSGLLAMFAPFVTIVTASIIFLPYLGNLIDDS